MDRDEKLQTIRRSLTTQYEQLAANLEDAGNGKNNGNAYNPDRNDLANDYRNRERSTSLRALEEQTLHQVKEALTQIEEGTYGRCVQCHQPINVERLEILPYATLCIRCQNEAANTQ